MYESVALACQRIRSNLVVRGLMLNGGNCFDPVRSYGYGEITRKPCRIMALWDTPFGTTVVKHHIFAFLTLTYLYDSFINPYSKHPTSISMLIALALIIPIL